MTLSIDAVRLAQRLSALAEPAMRKVVLAEYLARTEAKNAAAVLHEIQAVGRTGGPPFNIALLTLVLTLSEKTLPYELQVGLYTAAKEAGLVTLAKLFFSDLGKERLPLPSTPLQQELTLGHRKWLARSSDRPVLERLLRHPEAEVLPLLLQNPKIVEKDVVALASRRPTRPDLQWTIFGSRRWISRYAVKRTLVLNPYTPTDLSLRLLGFLNHQDLRLVDSSPALPRVLREAVRSWLKPGG